nr:putative ribonuclease H-like domain-containing protein [Tanacetum cinerariifolium]
MRARRFLQKTGRNLDDNRVTSMGFDMSKVKCYNCHRKGHFARECRSPKDSRRSSATEPQRRTALVENSTSNALVSHCDGIGCYDWSYQAEDKPANFALMAITSSSSFSDNEVPSCSKACSKAYAQLHSQYDKLTDDFRKSQFDFLSYQAGLEFVKARLVVYKQNESILEENIKLLNIEVQARDTTLVTFRQKLEKAEQERDDLKLKLDKFQTSFKNLIELLASQTNKKHGLGYFSLESDCESLSPSSLSDRSQPSGRYHAIPPPITRTFMPPKPDLVFHTALIAVETDHSVVIVQLSPSKLAQDLSHTNRPSAPIIEDWVSDSEDESKTNDLQIVPSFFSPLSKSVDHLIKDCDYHAKKKAQPTPRNYAHMGNNKQNASLTHKNPLKHMVPAAVHTRSKPVSVTDVRPVSVALPKIMVPVVSVAQGLKGKWGNLQYALKDKGVINSGCSRHIIGNMSYLSNFAELNGGYVAFGGNPKGGKISGKGKIKTGKLDFEDVYFAKELKFNLLNVSQMCDKKNSFLFTNTECLVLSPDFKLSDESQVLFRVPKENNMYNVNLKNIVPSRDLTCLFAKATIDESNLWHRRLGHINFKTINKLVKSKQHRASCKTKPVSSVDQPLFRLHMDLFGPTFVKSLNKKSYCLVITDDYSRFTWVFFLATKDETSPIPKGFITGLENQLSLKVKVIRSDNGTEFKNSDLNQFCGIKGIKREFSVPRTPQQNGIAERKNRTLIEAARTMLADLLLPIPFWAEAVNTACYNKKGDVAFDGKEHDVDTKKPESAVNVSPSSSAQSRKKDDKTKKKAKGKSPVESFTENRDLSAEFEDHFDNSSNDVNAVGSIVPTVGQNSSNSTNPFSTGGPSNINASPTHGKSSFKDASQLPDNPNMPEDITYFDDENVGAETDFNNLETSIIVSLIPTTRIHKDHPVSQIIGIVDRNRARLVAQGHIHEEGIDYEEVFAPVARIEAIRLFLAYASFMGCMVYQMDAPRAWHETLANNLLENGFHRGKIDQTLFIKKQKGDILLVQIYEWSLSLRRPREFLKTIDENMQQIIKKQVKEQVKTSYAVAADLFEMELKKILIEKMEGNKSIHRSNEQRNLYKALVEAYESDKIILDTYRDTVMLKRHHDNDADKYEEPSAGSDRGSKRRREGKEPESTSAPTEKATRSTDKSTQGSKSRQTSASESATVEEPMQTTFEMEEPSHLEFETGVDDQPIVQSSQHPEWFSQQKKPPTPDHDWNKTFLATHGSIQPWISELTKQSDSRSSFN